MAKRWELVGALAVCALTMLVPTRLALAFALLASCQIKPHIPDSTEHHGARVTVVAHGAQPVAWATIAHMDALVATIAAHVHVRHRTHLVVLSLPGDRANDCPIAVDLFGRCNAPPHVSFARYSLDDFSIAATIIESEHRSNDCLIVAIAAALTYPERESHCTLPHSQTAEIPRELTQFVQWLVREYGVEKVLAWHRATSQRDDAHAMVESFYGVFSTRIDRAVQRFEASRSAESIGLWSIRALCSGPAAMTDDSMLSVSIATVTLARAERLRMSLGNALADPAQPHTIDVVSCDRLAHEWRASARGEHVTVLPAGRYVVRSMSFNPDAADVSLRILRESVDAQPSRDPLIERVIDELPEPRSASRPAALTSAPSYDDDHNRYLLRTDRWPEGPAGLRAFSFVVPRYVEERAAVYLRIAWNSRLGPMRVRTVSAEGARDEVPSARDSVWLRSGSLVTITAPAQSELFELELEHAHFVTP